MVELGDALAPLLRLAGDRIAEITTFDAELFPALGLPQRL